MKDLRNKLITEISEELCPIITPEEREIFTNILYRHLNKYEIQERVTEISILDDTPDKILRRFIATKRIEGRSEKTLQRYYDLCFKMIHTINKPLEQITTYDLRYYLSIYKENRKVSNHTLDGMRRVYKAFFSFLTVEQIISTDPSLGLSKIKYEKVVKEAYSNIDVEKIKRVCKTARDRALVEILYCTGCRVSEVVKLNKSDVNFVSQSIIVLGKGNKQRVVYISDVAMLYLVEYINSRKDSNEALFVGIKAPYERLSKNGIESRLKTLGKFANVENVHPHRYRRTLATNLLDRGSAIQDVAQILGHEKISTTQIYYQSNQENVHNSYNKYI